MADYYDLVLALIPLVFAGTAAALTVLGLSATAAIPVGALAVFPVVGHAMFVRVPGNSTSETDQTPDAAAQSGLQAAD